MKKSTKVVRVKRTRSIFTSGKVKLGTKVHRPKTGKGSYIRWRSHLLNRNLFED